MSGLVTLAAFVEELWHGKDIGRCGGGISDMRPWGMSQGPGR